MTDEESLTNAITFTAIVAAEGDSDGDGLEDLTELNEIGTDPQKFDTDGDLLGDGFEYDGGLDPLDADENGNGISDGEDDFDNDGLNNLGEQIYGTDPTQQDSDGDGVSDVGEIDQGSNPNDASDGGLAPDEEDVVRITVMIGDPSGSNSEYYKLTVGDRTFIGHPCLEVACATAMVTLPRGEAYEIQITHLTGDNDLDYIATVEVDAEETDPYHLDGHGPDSDIIGVVAEMEAIHNGVMEYLSIHWLENPNRRIDIVGHSRGGYLAMEIARDLQTEGLGEHASVDVRFLGLYDPVDMAPGYGDAETVSGNVETAAVVFASGRSDMATIE